jgi:hypothetical protein
VAVGVPSRRVTSCSPTWKGRPDYGEEDPDAMHLALAKHEVVRGATLGGRRSSRSSAWPSQASTAVSSSGSVHERAMPGN